MTGQIALTGNSVAVAYDPVNLEAAVASGAGGLNLVDVSDSSNPKLIMNVSLPFGTQAVEAYDGLFYVASGRFVITVDPVTGEIIQSLDTGGTTITGLSRDGSMLYTMDAAKRLTIVDASNFLMVKRGSVTLPEGGGSLFVSNGTAYAAAATRFAGGYVTANVSNPDAPTSYPVDPAYAAPPIPSLPSAGIGLNGSGLGVLVGIPPRSATGPALELLNTSDPTSTTTFITLVKLPASGTPYAVDVASGIAYIADGTGGLEVVNYEAFDTGNQAPKISISSTVTDIAPNTPGFQVAAGSAIPIALNVTDDVQVRNVQLLINGKVVADDVSLPFDFVATAPALPNGVTSSALTIQVRAYDTGGNSSLSNTLSYQVVPDTVPPTVIASTPLAGQKVFYTPSISVDFSKPIDKSKFSLADVSLVYLGTDANPVTPVSIPLETFAFQVLGRELVLYPSQLLDTGNYSVTIAPSAIFDKAGNELASPYVLKFTVRPASDIHAASGVPAIGRAPAANVGQEIGFQVPWQASNTRFTFATTDDGGNPGTTTVGPTQYDPVTQTAYVVVPYGASTGTLAAPNLTIVGTPGQNYKGLANWLATTGSINVYGPGYNDFLPGNSNYVALANYGTLGQLNSSDFTLTPGHYHLSYSLAGAHQGSDNNDNVAVSLGSAYSATFTAISSDAGFTTHTADFTITSTTIAALVFAQTAGYYGVLLDQVSLTNTDTSAVLLSDNFDLTFPDGPLPLQVVPVVSNVDQNNVGNSFHGGFERLSGSGFIEGGITINYGAKGLVDPDTGSGTIDVYSSGTQLNVNSPYVPAGAQFGPITVTTAGGTSAPFQRTFSTLTSVALSGTPADATLPSANPGQAITIVGSHFTSTTDVIFTAVDDGGNFYEYDQRPFYVSADGSTISLTVPNQATTGPVGIVGDQNNYTPTLQIVPVVTGLSVNSDGTSYIYGSGFVEGASTYTYAGGSVTDTSTSSSPIDVYSSGTVAYLNGVLPQHGLGGFTVTSAGGTSAPFGDNTVFPKLPNNLTDIGIDTSGKLWVATDTQIVQVDPATGVASKTYSWPGGNANGYGGIQVLPTAMTLNGVPIAAGSLLLTNGQISPDTIYAMNPATGVILASLPLAKQTLPATEINPTAGLYDQATNLIYVLGYSDNKIDAINPATGAIVNSFASPVPQNSGGLAIDPTTHQLWAVSYGSTIAYLLNKGTGVILQEMDFSTVGVTNQITGMVFDSAGKIWLSEYGYGVLYHVDPATVGPQIPAPPVLTGITTVARDGTPKSSSSSSANVAQVVNLVGTGFTINTQVGFATRDNSGNVGLTYVNPTAVNGAGTQLQAVVPDNATTGNVTVYAPRASQNLGFSSYTDSVYRNITVPFTAQGTLDSIKFSDGSIQGISDESWGIDNVKVLDASNNVVYSTNFENGAGPEWSNRTTDDSYPATFSQFLGRFSNDLTFLSLANLTVGGKYTLHFDFYAIDTWDGNTSSGSGPDYFDVGVDGTRLFHNTFLNYNAFASGVSQTYTDATTGQGSVYLQVVPTLTGVTSARRQRRRVHALRQRVHEGREHGVGRRLHGDRHAEQHEHRAHGHRRPQQPVRRVRDSRRG